MIRRDSGNDWLLISQAEHACLAGDLAAAWGNEQVPALPVADQLVRAVRDHDNGWRRWEQSPEIDPAAGWPRNFTEMPATTAAPIWSASIESAARGEFSHAAALRQFERHLQAHGEPLTWEDVQILEAALEFRVPFTTDEVIRRTGNQGAGRTLGLLQSSGVVRAAWDEGTERFEVTAPTLGSAPLPGIWVSRHFCHLAEQARTNRNKLPAEQQALATFLSEQSDKQAQWKNEAVREFAGEHLDRLIDGGFRYVQFFDRLSLWLCMAERSEPGEFDVPSGGQTKWRPLSPQEIEIDPWPFSVKGVELTVPARRIPARIYRDDSDLHDELKRAPLIELHWTLYRA